MLARNPRIGRAADLRCGVKFSGDITKAIASGADAVMIGSLLAGTEESPVRPFFIKGAPSRVIVAWIDGRDVGHARRSDRYARSQRQTRSEGIEGRVPYKGPLSEMVYQLVGGLRAGMAIAAREPSASCRTKRNSSASHRPAA